MSMVAPAAGFRADVAQRLTGISYRQLDYWDKTGLVRPSIRQARGKGSRRVYSFERSGRAARRRADARPRHHITQRTEGRPLPQGPLRPRHPAVIRMALIASGRSILMRAHNPSRLVDVTAAGQLVLTIAVSPIARELEKNVTRLRAPREDLDSCPEPQLQGDVHSRSRGGRLYCGGPGSSWRRDRRRFAR